MEKILKIKNLKIDLSNLIFSIYIQFVLKLNIQMDQEKSKFNQTDIYRVSRDSRLNQGLFLSKLILKKHGTVQIEGMGESISLVAKISQILSKNGFATIKNVSSGNVERNNSRSINPKLTIKLAKSAEFDKLTESIVLRQ